MSGADRPSVRDGWLGRAEDMLSAHFFDEAGVSRPGVDVRIGLKQGDALYSVMVRAFLGDSMSAKARKDTQYLAQTALGYVFDRLDAGWRPGQSALPPITITS